MSASQNSVDYKISVHANGNILTLHRSGVRSEAGQNVKSSTDTTLNVGHCLASWTFCKTHSRKSVKENVSHTECEYECVGVQSKYTHSNKKIKKKNKKNTHTLTISHFPVPCCAVTGK